jgi:hypothetical protein
VVAKIRDRQWSNKGPTNIIWGGLISRNKCGRQLEQYHVDISESFTVLEDLDTEVDINSAHETTWRNINISAKESLGYYKLKAHRPSFDKGCSKWLVHWKQAKLQDKWR